ncbi:DUF6427 family protein [Polaribacter sp. Z022]|uniref:DUF6427 family protein n=1 Tax=Polaribacter sp. Z022 TaxID=2927125 RepID=UPI0020221027|nr:DUF6427 family protein [Polaribacter sp. Z022]MCL7752696.1 DUF6427 family protein [Polaribacter sp. Z022]
MLANFLEKSKPINFIFYLGLFFSFFLFSVFSDLFNENFTWIKALENISFLMLFLAIFFFYHFVVTKNKLTFDNSYAYFIFTLGLALFTTVLLDFKTLSSILIHLLFLRKLYSLRSSKNVIQKIFDSGFWLGIMCILEPSSLLFIILVYAAILLQQKLTIHTLLTPVLGFISPIIIYFAYLLWQDSTFAFTKIINLEISNNLSIYTDNYFFYIFLTTLLLTICAVLLKSPKALSVNNSFKKSWLLLIINLIIAILFALIVSNKNGSEIVLFLIPASVIIANGFEVIQKNFIKDILFSLLIAITVITYFWL